MPQLIRPNVVQTVTKEGEILIRLELEPIEININLNMGAEGVSIQSESTSTRKKRTTDDDKVEWAIPDFGGSEKINFGKKE